MPLLSSVNPGLVSAFDVSSVSITVTGKYFGSAISRGYYAESYGHVDVFVGQTKCASTIFMSDEQLVCGGVAAGGGLFAVSVQVFCF